MEALKNVEKMKTSFKEERSRGGGGVTVHHTDDNQLITK